MSSNSNSNSSGSIVVVGSGVHGLASAIQLLWRGHQHVTIITEATTPNTVSDQAGALW